MNTVKKRYLSIDCQLRVYWFLFLLTIAKAASSQVYPVVVNATLRPPYSLNLSDYASPLYDRFQASVYLADLTKVNYPVKVRLVIKGSGGITLTTLPGQEAGPYYLNGGQSLILTGADLNKLFSPEKLQFSGMTIQEYRRNAALPEGVYQFQLEIVDYNLNVVVSNVNVGFSTAWLVLNDPPILNKPENNSTIVPKNPQNLFFQWTPRHTGSPNSAFTTVYDLQIVEIFPQGRNPNDAMLTSPTIFEKTITTTSYNYSVIDPYLTPGRWYAFRVRAHDKDNRDLFKNKGYSEVYQFFYGQECPVPQNVKAEYLQGSGLLVYWTPQTLFKTVEVQYKADADKNWKSITSSTNKTVIKEAVSDQKYLVRLMGTCQNNYSLFSDPVVYTPAGNIKNNCEPPQNFNASLISSNEKTQTVKLSWIGMEGIKSYGVFIESSDQPQTVNVKAKDFPDNNPYINFTIPKGAFKITFSVVCPDGSTAKGEPKSIDLTKGNVSSSTCTLSQPENVNASFKDNVINLTWNKQTGFDMMKLRYRILGEQTFKEILVEENVASIPKSDPTKVYEYQVVYYCNAGKWIEGAFNTFKLAVGNAVPTKIVTGDCFPPSGIAYQINPDLTVKLGWMAEKDASSYTVYWRKKGLVVWDSAVVSNTDYTTAKLTTGTDYEYQISSVCKNGGKSMRSSIQSFNTGSVTISSGTCDAPILKSPVSLSGTEERVEWEPRSNYTGYIVEYRLKGNNTWTALTPTGTLALASNLKASTKYEYHVAALCGTKQSSFSATDTFTTASPAVTSYSCGQNIGLTVIKTTTPVTSLNVGDVFTTADFDMTLKSFTSEKPYNGEATAQIPYLKYSTFVFGMENVQINDTKQMYGGKIYLKGANIMLIDPKLASSITSFANKLNDGLSKASTYLVLADSIQDALNDLVATANEPIDWTKYQGWTAQQLFDEGKRLVALGESLIKQGTPTSIAQAKQMLKEGIELIKAAASLGNAGVQLVSAKVKGWLDKILNKMEENANTQIDVLEDEIAQDEPVLETDYDNTQDQTLNQYVLSPGDSAVGIINSTPDSLDVNAQKGLQSNQRLGNYYKDFVDYRKNEYNLERYNKILGYVEFFRNETNAQQLVTDIEKDLKATLKNRKLEDIPEAEMDQLTAQIESYIQKYLEDKANQDLTNSK